MNGYEDSAVTVLTESGFDDIKYFNYEKTEVFAHVIGHRNISIVNNNSTNSEEGDR